MTPSATIVIVHHRGRERLFRTLEVSTAQAARDQVETIVVDNASREGAGAEAARRFPAVRWLRQASNLGFAAACNLGAGEAAAPLLIFLNDDAVPEEGWLDTLLAAAAARAADVVAVAGRMTDTTGTRNDFATGFLTFDGHAFATDAGRAVDAYSAGQPGDERLFACGGNMLVAKDVFLGSGGFDADYFAYLEDVDFGWRQWIEGRRITFEPRASVRHEGGATGEALGLFARGYLIEKNAFATAFKNLEEDYLRDLLPAILATFMSRLAAMTSRRNPGAAVALEDPYATPGGVRRTIWARRLARLVGIRPEKEVVRLDDPLTVAQLRALLSIFGDAERLAQKRRAVQTRRVRSGREILGRFPLAIVPTYVGDEIFGTEFFRIIAPARLTLVRRELSEIFHPLI